LLPPDIKVLQCPFDNPKSRNLVLHKSALPSFAHHVEMYRQDSNFRNWLMILSRQYMSCWSTLQCSILIQRAAVCTMLELRVLTEN
jgi:hypothetical protein